jgi:hypothetical protein
MDLTHSILGVMSQRNKVLLWLLGDVIERY